MEWKITKSGESREKRNRIEIGEKEGGKKRGKKETRKREREKEEYLS